MNKNKLKVYAPKAREEFIKVVSERAAAFGITAKKIAPCKIKGNYAFISGKLFPKSIEKSRNGLIEKIESKGFTQVMEEVAYTWFNRFAAIRLMELNGYLTHGYRVLSHTQGQSEPEILEKAQYLEGLDGLEKKEIIALKTAGNKDTELYRKLIIAQCNELHSAMPFLFEKVDGPTELLLPDNLLNTDSIIRQMVEEIPEEDWKQVEIIGWLYQFYISDKKDALMKAKKAYKTEDIPAVTQLFTPNWIVKYLVQNSLGAKWLETYPSSGIKSKMEYYIEPAEQTDKVKQQLKEITPASLNPEELTVMDPACGSGHILVEAYNLIKEIYLECGYRPKDIPALILTKNLYGLEIDDHAAQLAGFALMMKARQDDRQIFEKQIMPNITCLKSANGMGGHFKEARELIALFDNAKTFGSLIRIPEDLRDKLPQIKKIADKKKSGDLFEQKDAEIVIDLLKQAEFLSERYDCVIANPPYMGGKGMNGLLKGFAEQRYSDSKSDLFAMFVERSVELAQESGLVAMITMQSWMFLNSYDALREKLFVTNRLIKMFHTGPGLFPDLGAFNVLTTNFVICKSYSSLESVTRFIKANNTPNYKDKIELLRDPASHVCIPITKLKSVPGFPLIYWLSSSALSNFERLNLIGDTCPPKQGLATGENAKFVRFWHEVSLNRIGLNFDSSIKAKLSGKKWFPYNKGGNYRKWYGNNDSVVNWENDGKEIKNFTDENGRLRSAPRNLNYYYREGIVYSLFGFENFGVRYKSSGFIFDVSGSSIFPEQDLEIILAFLCSNVAFYYLRALAPTVNFQVGDLARLPLPNLSNEDRVKVFGLAKKNIDLCKSDWDFVETSWDFEISPLVRYAESSFQDACNKYLQYCEIQRNALRENEQSINIIMIASYHVKNEVEPTVNDRDLSIKNKELSEIIKEFISYSVGCMMGRYSLDKPGLVYAHSSNDGFDASQYKTFPADDDGIVPITDHEWFDDDAACRFYKFIETAWDKKGLDANLDFIADAISRKANESSREAIRRYFLDNFYKDHCQAYKKRPIYWLFTSGKDKAFQALVYLHRYNEGTLSRMRTEYVLPLQTKINRHIEHLEKDKDSATSTSAANKIQKEITSLLKQKEELIKFDERLRHYADMKIKLDLDDGVKVNYAKFEDLLADSKNIVGKKK